MAVAAAAVSAAVVSVASGNSREAGLDSQTRLHLTIDRAGRVPVDPALYYLRGPMSDPASLIDAAQQAAGAGDYATAERLLRDAAGRQEAALGSDHLDLATTLNNLAFVCERLEKYDEAERGYRRAHAIAVASLSPGHPFIKTSLTNLLDFCAAREIPLWTPPETPTEDEALPDDADIEPSPIDVAPDVAPEVIAEPVAGSRLSLRLVGAAALVIATVVVILFARQGQGRTETPRPVAESRPESVPPPAPPAPVNTIAPVPPPAAESTVTPRPHREPVTAKPNASASALVTVLKAQLCTRLERTGSPDWHCTPASGDLRPGTYTFYTRLLTPEQTRVEHRWYFSGRVHQVMRLHVPANGSAGYRTFSSNRVISERAGEWKVELRAADGSLLHEERFVVR